LLLLENFSKCVVFQDSIVLEFRVKTTGSGKGLRKICY